MRRTDREEQRNKDRGIGAGDAQLEQSQRDVEQDVQHMPRHWQESGGRGQLTGQTPPEVDDREVARGNQYGETGEIAREQVHDSLTEHGEEPPPQRRENDQLPKRAGEGRDDLPTPTGGDKANDLPPPAGGNRTDDVPTPDRGK